MGVLGLFCFALWVVCLVGFVVCCVVSVFWGGWVLGWCVVFWFVCLCLCLCLVVVSCGGLWVLCFAFGFYVVVVGCGLCLVCCLFVGGWMLMTCLLLRCALLHAVRLVCWCVRLFVWFGCFTCCLLFVWGGGLVYVGLL